MKRIAVALSLLCGLGIVTGAEVTQAAPADAFVPLANPGRVLDTRFGLKPDARSVTQVNLGSLPGGAASAVLNVTVTGTESTGYLTVYSCAATRPEASNLNFVAGQTVANNVIARADGPVCVYLEAAAHLIVDISGYFPTVDSFTPLAAPQRALDTRPGAPTADGLFAGAGARGADSTLVLAVADRVGVPADAESVVLNVTSTGATGDGYLTIFPCGAGQPTASNLNFVTGQTIANNVIARVGDGGNVCIYSAASTHLLVDIAGYFADATSFVALPNPARAMETRPAPTTDGQFSGIGIRPNEGVVTLPLTGRFDIPADASSVVLNVTVTGSTELGYLTVFPGGEGRPNTSNLNYDGGQTIANGVIARLGAGGTVCIYNSTSTHLIVDVAGWISGDAPPAAVATPCPVPVAPPATFQPGAYVVGSQIPAGRYASSAQAGCYWERVDGFGGTLDEIIANDFRTFAGPLIVDIAASDAGFAFEPECGVLQSYAPSGSTLTSFGSGSFAVGVAGGIVPGTYSVDAGANCYWERLSGFGNTLEEVIANDVVTGGGPTLVTISPSDVGFFSDSDCGMWSKVG